MSHYCKLQTETEDCDCRLPTKNGSFKSNLGLIRLVNPTSPDSHREAFKRQQGFRF